MPPAVWHETQARARIALGLCKDLREWCRVDHVLPHLGPPINAWKVLEDHPDAYDFFRTRYHEALRILQEVEGKSLIIEALEGLGLVAEAADEPERAARLLAAAESLRAATGALPIRPQDPGYARYRAHALARRCESAYPGAWAEGERMSLDQIIAYALETTGSDEPSA